MAKRNREMSLTEMMFYTDRPLFERALGNETTELMGWYFRFKDFYTGPRQDLIDESRPALETLMLKQYPLTAAFTHPEALICIKDVHEMNASGLIHSCWKMMEDMNAGVHVPTKYPELEQWRSFYCSPEVPEEIGPEMVRILPGDTEETIRERVEAENAEIRAWHEGEQEKKDAYYAIMQPLLFKHLPELDQLEGDHWVIYAMRIRDAYEEWKSLCEQMETTIEYDMPQESICWEYPEWQALLSKKFRARKGR